MQSRIFAACISQARETLPFMLTDTVDIWRQAPTSPAQGAQPLPANTGASDGYGGEQAPSTPTGGAFQNRVKLYSAVPCRLSPKPQRTGPAFEGDKLTQRAQWVLKVAANTDVQPDDVFDYTGASNVAGVTPRRHVFTTIEPQDRSTGLTYSVIVEEFV